jgi:hypothetical protein
VVVDDENTEFVAADPCATIREELGESEGAEEDVEAAFSVAKRFLQAREDKRAQTSKLEQALMNLVVQVEEDVRASDMTRHLREALADALELLKPNTKDNK